MKTTNQTETPLINFLLREKQRIYHLILDTEKVDPKSLTTNMSRARYHNYLTTFYLQLEDVENQILEQTALASRVKK
jgi:hypothetical protein